MKALSLFAGIGGFDLALERVGGSTVAFVEREPFCQAVLRKHWPDIPIHDDIKTFSGVDLRGRVDLVMGGPPCQPSSLAGKRQGASDSRWLWDDFLRVVREVRPRFVLAENPPGIITLKPLGLDWILASLEEAGYQCEAITIGAWAIGAPHKRERVWIVARRLDDTARPRLSGDAGRESPREVWNAARGPESAGSGGSGLADRRGDPIREQPGRSSGEGWAGATIAGELGTDELAGGGGESESRGEQGSRGNVADGCGVRGPEATNLGDADRAGLGEHGGAVAVRAQLGAVECASHHGWPARPGEPQHEWEEPRLVEFPVGGDVAGIPVRLARAWNRNALRALGNAIVPQVAEAVLRAMLAHDETTKPRRGRMVGRG